MRVPKNRIQTGKYTSGGEFLYKKTDTPYQGHYYILNNLYYAGKEFKNDAPELIKIVNANKLSFSSATSIFSVISGITSQKLRAPKVLSVQSNIESNPTPIRYFSQQVNIQPITIKEINKETYESLQSNELYKTTFIGPNQNLEEANKKMPGLKDWLLG